MRYFYNKKATTEESYDIDIRVLKKRKLLSGKHSTTITWTHNRSDKVATIGIEVDVTEDPLIRLYYYLTDRDDGTETKYDYEVSLITTDCNLGGVRYWFACPHCGRRVGVLYLAPGDEYFRCRHCNNLSYQSRNRSTLEAFGHTSRQIDELHSQIKRWTWRGRPTRKVRRLQALQRKMQILSGPIMARIERFSARLR